MSCTNASCVESRAQSEQLFGQLEAQFNDLHEAHKTVTEEKTRLAAALKEASENRETQKVESLKLQRRAEEAEQQSHRSDLALKREKEESESARQQLDQRLRDLDRIQTDFKTMSDRLNESGKRESSLSSELSSVRSALVPLQLQSERLFEEKTLWLKQKSWLEGELENRSTALLEARKQASAKEVELTSQLERARQEVSAHERRAKEAIDELGSTRQRLNESSLKLQSTETASSKKLDGLSRELASLSKLCALHEENASAATKRVAELEAHSSALRLEAEGALKKSAEDATRTLTEARTEHERVVAELKKDVKLLQEQHAAEKKAASGRIGPAAQVLEALDRDSSTGGAATSTALELLSRASSSMQGGGANDLTATALYSRVVVAEGALAKEKDESNKLRTYLGQILHEIENKAPLIAQQRRDYERALIAHEELSRRLAATSRDAAQVSADLGAEKDARSRADALAESLQGEVADLKKQVLALIRAGKNSAHANPGGDAFTLEDLSSSSAFANSSKSAAMARTNGWPTTDAHLLQLASQDDPAARDKLSEAAASAIIDESLLTYADVKELQERNQQLIRVLRLLARQLGKLSSSANNGSSSSLDAGSSSNSSSSINSSMVLGASGFGGSGIGFGPAGSSAREALVALHNELSELRASRERQAAMVATVAQQRDMYRMLLSQADSSLLAKGDASVGGGGVGGATTLQLTAGVSSPSGGAGPDPTRDSGAALGLSQLTSSSARDANHSSRLAASASAVTAMAQATADNLQAMLDEARGELERTRSDARSAIKAAEARTEQLRNECVELNKTMIAAQGEARFQTERATQLQHSADASREEASRELKRSLQLQVSFYFFSFFSIHFFIPRFPSCLYEDHSKNRFNPI
jgi:nucleoprotein TPR